MRGADHSADAVRSRHARHRQRGQPARRGWRRVRSPVSQASARVRRGRSAPTCRYRRVVGGLGQGRSGTIRCDRWVHCGSVPVRGRHECAIARACALRLGAGHVRRLPRDQLDRATLLHPVRHAELPFGHGCALVHTRDPVYGSLPTAHLGAVYSRLIRSNAQAPYGNVRGFSI